MITHLTTGFSSSMGTELLLEGKIPTEWLDYYMFTGEAQSHWTWDYITMDNAIHLGQRFKYKSLPRTKN